MKTIRHRLPGTALLAGLFATTVLAGAHPAAAGAAESQRA